MPRRSFVARGAAAVGALAAGPLALAGRAGAQGVGKGELGVAGVDHVGITVPDLNQAVEWFEDILGAVAPLSFGPFGGSFLEGALDVPAGTQIDRITTLRLGRSANIELFAYTAPNQRHDMP